MPSPMSEQPQVIAVVGPTATGKTGIGVALARHYGSEVISADSQLVYRGLDIGTAKPTPAETQGIPHHMIDLVDPTEAYSVAQYQEAASGVLQCLLAAGKVPIVAGGTGFYVKALLQEQFIPNVPPNQAFRDEMQALAETHGRAYVHERLRERDPRRAADLHPNDLFRVIRALEIIEATGAPVPDSKSARPLRVRWFGLTSENRDLLRARIDARIDGMLAAGWLTEVAGLMARYGVDAHALQVAHGYPELVQHLQGQRSLEDAVEQIRINIHQYATRQLTWFRANPAIEWLDVFQHSPDELVQASLGT